MSSILKESDQTLAVNSYDTINQLVIDEVQQLVQQQLAPLTTKIDREGLYPATVLHNFGQAGAFNQHLSSQNDTGKTDLITAVQTMAVISKECLSTGFMAWCQDVLGWYVENSDNSHLHQTVLPRISRGEFLGGTALSNPMKYFSAIEPLQLRATPVQGGFIQWDTTLGIQPWAGPLLWCYRTY